MEPKIEIVNIVATLKLDPMPKPDKILERIPRAKSIRRFHGAMIRLDKIPILFYRDNIIITGLKSMNELDQVIRNAISLLQGRGFNVKIISRQVVNITVKVELGIELNLYEVARKLNGIYDPDYRPYVIARLNGTTLLVSQMGKLVLLGAKSLEQVYNILGKALALIT